MDEEHHPIILDKTLPTPFRRSCFVASSVRYDITWTLPFGLGQQGLPRCVHIPIYGPEQWLEQLCTMVRREAWREEGVNRRKPQKHSLPNST